MRRIAPIVGLLIAAQTLVAQGQQLRGAIRDSATSAPIPGVVITLLDAAGATAGRTITDASGRYAVTVAPSATRVRFIRIGFRPRELALPPADRRDAFNVAMDRLPPILETVRVSGSELCPGSTDRGAAFQAWEQARAGLLATIVAREAKPAHTVTLIYESGMSPSDERIHRQTKRTNAGVTTRPFVSSAAPSFFAQHGYMLEDNGSRIYNAPDADVLMDESFAATHCFRLRAADVDHLGQIGLAFAPVPNRDTLVDVTGVIWMDARTPQLRALDFAYTSLEPAATRARAGGHIEFRTMDNGVAFIERWNLRLPVLSVELGSTGSTSSTSSRGANALPQTRSERTGMRVGEIVEAGGIVVSAKWSDGTAWDDVPARITGVVMQRGSSQPVPNAIVHLVGTQDTVTTAATGEFSLDAIPGKYLLAAADTLLKDFAQPRSQSVPVVVSRAATVSAKLEVAPMEGVISDVCRGTKMRPNTAMIVGVVGITDRPVSRDAVVRAKWQADYTKDAISGIRIDEQTQETTIDDRGRFVVCGVVRERPIHLSLATRQGLIGDTTFTIYSNTMTHPVRWLIEPAKPAPDRRSERAARAPSRPPR